ncbi:MAG: ATP-dependent endonuclease [Conexivisphaerales archaeon]
MIISEVRIKNFRALRNLEVRLNKLSVIVGSNGSGKSSFLRALQLFFDNAAEYTEEDFHRRDTSNPIEIEITFANLSRKERQSFASYTHDGKLIVLKKLLWPKEKTSRKYYGYILQNTEFEEVREAPNADQKRKMYEHLRNKYQDLPMARTGKDIEDALVRWEQSNPSKCQLVPKETQFFGFSNVGSGRIDQYVNLIVIPAVKDASEESEEARGSELSKLIQIAVREKLQENPKFKKLDKQTRRQYKKIMEGRQLKKIVNGICKQLEKYAPGVMLRLRTETDQVDILSNFIVGARLIEDDYEADVALAGHGSQRAFIMALLEYINQFRHKTTSGNRYIKNIICIEEPELYQHPARQRHIAETFRLMSKNLDTPFQVICVTHSPYFVDITELDNIVRFYKEKDSDDSRYAKTVQATLDECARELGKAWNRNWYSGSVLRERLYPIATNSIKEAFFAKVVVLVEGEEDKAYIQGYAEAKGINLDTMDVAVVACNGKGNIDKLLVILRRFKIPVYAIWDLDQDNKDPKNDDVNNTLLRLCGASPGDYSTKIKATFACFKTNIGQKIKEEIGPEFEKNLQELAAREGTDLDRVKKNSYLIRMAMEKCSESNKKSNTLESIIKKIVGLRNEND